MSIEFDVTVKRRAQLICVWSGPALIVVFAIGAALVGQLIPPFAEPSDTAREIAGKYAARTTDVRIGSVLAIIGMALLATWGAAIAAQTRPAEGEHPVLAYVQIACVGAATCLLAVICTVWTVTAFRPEAYPDAIVQYSNDLAYLLFVFTWPLFTVWVWAIALAILADERPAPAYPRWAAFLSAWVGLLIAGGAGSTFFKTGALAYNGLLGLYVPIIAFFIWIVAMTILTLRNIKLTQASNSLH